MIVSWKSRATVFLSVLTLWLLHQATVSRADELVGKVVSVDETSYQLIIAEQGHELPDKDQGRLVTARLPKHMIFRRPTGRMIPRWAGVGNMIRLRGYYSGDERQLFIVTMIHHHFRGPGFDPTGVRSRIGKGCRPGFGMRNGHGLFKERTERSENRRDSESDESDSESDSEEDGK